MKKLRIGLSVLLALAMFLCVCVTAYAIGAPSNLNWSGTVACWSGPSDIGNGYVVCLYKNGSQVSYFTTFSSATDMKGGMEMNGAGDYTFSVYIDYGDVTSETKYSSVHTYTPAHTHTMKHIDFTYPDWTSEGVKEHYECTGCGKWYWDNLGEYEITDHSDVSLPAMGHHWGDWKVDQKPTKTEKGIEMRTCYEDPDHAEYRDIPALGDDTPATEAKKATEKATEATTEKATEDATEKATELATQDPSAPTTPGAGTLSFGGTIPWLIIGAIALIVIGTVIIILVIVLRKKGSKQPTPPVSQQRPVQQYPTQQYPVQQPQQKPESPAPADKKPEDGFGDHFDNM